MNKLKIKKFPNLNSFFINFLSLALSVIIFFPIYVPSIVKLIIFVLTTYFILPYEKSILKIKFNLFTFFILFLSAFLTFSYLYIEQNNYLYKDYIFDRIFQLSFNICILFIIYSQRKNIINSPLIYIKKIQVFLNGFSLYSLFFSFLAINNFLKNPLIFYNKGRFAFGITNPNIAGFNLLIIALSLIVLFLINKNINNKKLFLNIFDNNFIQTLLLIFYLTTISLTGSRTAILSYIFYLIMYICLKYDFKHKFIDIYHLIIFGRKNFKKINFLSLGLFVSLSISLFYFVPYLIKIMRVFEDLPKRSYSLLARLDITNLFFEYFDKPGVTIYQKLLDNYGAITLDNSLLESYFLLGPFIAFFILILLIKPSIEVINKSPNKNKTSALFFLNSSYLITILGNDFIHASQFIFYYFLNLLIIKIAFYQNK